MSSTHHPPSSTDTTPAQTNPGRTRWLTATEERELLRQAQAGSETAQAALVTAFEPLVAGLAQQLVRRRLDWDDLLQAGRLGLLEAIGRFDLAQPVRFATLARYRVRWSLQQAVARAMPLSAPEREQRLLRQVQAVALRLQAETGEPPSAAQVAQAAGLSVAEVTPRLGRSLGALSLDELPEGQQPRRELTDSHLCAQTRQWRYELAAAGARLWLRLGRCPSPTELAGSLGLPLAELEAALTDPDECDALPSLPAVA